jgi:4-hydroxy-tetrahydrodipicolinate synthase
MISGSIVALVTPMTPAGEVDWQALARLVDFHLQEGSDALVAVGTTGESATLTVAEHCEVISRVVDQVNGRIPVIAGTGANATREAMELTREAAARKVDACLLVTPYYNKPTQEGLYQHYRYLATSIDIPQILYNVPGRTAVDMLNATVERLADLPNIIGIKDATGDVQRGRALLDLCGDRLAVYSGDDATAVHLMLAGGQGNISVTANVVPAAMARMCRLAMQGETGSAKALNEALMPLHQALFVESNPIPVKFVLHKMSLIDKGIRLPLTWLDQGQQHRVLDALQQCAVLQISA